MKRLCSAFLSLVLTCVLAVPALAWEEPDRKFPSFGQYLEFYRASSDEDTKALVRFLEKYTAAHPNELSAFDPHAWFAANLEGTGAGVNEENWFSWGGADYGEGAFRAEMTNLWLTGLYRTQRETGKTADLTTRYPNDYASFDADAWFAGYYGGILGRTKTEYMDTEGLAGEEDFRAAMFGEWALGTRARFNGLVVMVDGTPVQFQTVRTVSWEVANPVARDGRILVPLRTVAEAMNFAVAYDGAEGTVSCTKGGKTVLFTLDSTAYFVTADGVTIRLSLDVPAAAHDGRTYVLLRALAEALGYAVTWNELFQTAALT